MLRASLATVVILLGLAACGQEDEPERASLMDPVAAPHEPVFLIADADGGLQRRGAGAEPALCTGIHTIRAPSMHHDAQRFCFLGRSTDDAPWRLYTASIQGAAPTAVVDVAVDAKSAPAWLPDGRIVFSARAEDASRALFVASPEGGPAQRITFSDTDAHDPCVLRDGRVLYAGSHTTTEGTRAPALFTLHPDGTGVLLFHAATPGARYARPRQGPNGDVVFLVRADGSTRAWVADWRAPAEAAQALDMGAAVARAEADGEGAWLVQAEDGALHRIAGETTTAGPAWPDFHGFCTARARARPQGHMSMVSGDADTGSLLCVDARRGVEARAGFVRLHVRVVHPDAGGPQWQELGRVPLAADGSFFASVPADTPLRLDVLADDGEVLRTSRTPFWVRPGEVRGCTGCHDAPDATPPNCQPAAALEAAVTPRRRGAESGDR